MWFLILLVAGAAAAAPASRDSTEYPSPEALGNYTRGLLLEERGDPAGALDAYYRVLASDPRSVDALRKVSDLNGQQGDHTRSLEFADRALVLAPGDPRSLWLRGTALYNLGRGQEALESLDRAVASDPEDPEFWRTLARVAESLDRIDRVAYAYRRVVDLDDTDAESWFQLAGALARRGEFAGADSAMTESRELSPMRPGTDFLQAWIDEGLGRDDQAIEFYGHHLMVHPDDMVTRQRLVALLAGRSRFNDAYREARKLREARPQDPEVLETVADLAFRAGQPADATARLAELRRLDAEDPQLVWRAAVVLSHHRRIPEAVTMANTWARSHRGDSRGAMLMARVYTLNNDTPHALAAAREAVTLAPDSLAPRLTFGRIAQQARRWQDAVAVWDSLHRAMPNAVSVTLDLSYCREQLGDVDGAVAAAREALTVAPAEARVLNFLGYLMADHDRDLAQAERMIEQAVALEPDNGAYIDSLGWVFYRLGRLKEAREKLERAVQLTGGDPVVLDHLGDVYRDLRLLDLARAQYRKSLAADGSNHKVRNKLEAIR